MKTIDERKAELLDVCKHKAEHVIQIIGRLVKYLWEIHDIDEDLGNELLNHLDDWKGSDFEQMLNTLITKIEKHEKTRESSLSNRKNG